MSLDLATAQQLFPGPHNPFHVLSQVTDHLFLSGASVLNEENLRRFNIQHVINATHEVCCVAYDNIMCTRIPVDDDPDEDISRYFDQVADQINSIISMNHNVLVHCVAGASRSASLVLAYLMKYHHMSLKDSFIFLDGKRSVIRPNISFCKQLIEYENRLFNVNTVRMTSTTFSDGSHLEIPDLYNLPQFKKKALLEQCTRRRFKLIKERRDMKMREEQLYSLNLHNDNHDQNPSGSS